MGLGFGLQKIAANYVSGFMILAERSLRIGDMVKVDNFEGRISDIKTRYTVIRALNGRESIVPNESLITTRVENLSLADPQVSVSTVVQVAYGTDLDQLFPQLIEAIKRVPRVLSEPGPSVLLSNFAADGLELTISEGLISSLRTDDEGRLKSIQTSAPISQGSSGGGLFDADGRLIGITDHQVVLTMGQNLNFAIPADWIADVPARAQKSLAQTTAAPAASASGAQAAPPRRAAAAG